MAPTAPLHRLVSLYWIKTVCKESLRYLLLDQLSKAFHIRIKYRFHLLQRASGVLYRQHMSNALNTTNTFTLLEIKLILWIAKKKYWRINSVLILESELAPTPDTKCSWIIIRKSRTLTFILVPDRAAWEKRKSYSQPRLIEQNWVTSLNSTNIRLHIR